MIRIVSPGGGVTGGRVGDGWRGRIGIARVTIGEGLAATRQGAQSAIGLIGDGLILLAIGAA